MKMEEKEMCTRILRMDKEGCGRMKVVMILLVAILMVGIVSAQIIGGEIIADGNVNPSWQNVFVYDVADVNDYVEVLVSPDGYRYSFVNSRVGVGVIFGSDAVIRAEVLDFENGFMSGPVDMDLSGVNDKYYSCDDCDIFSKMEFREVVQVREPSRELYVSGDGSFDVEVNVYDDCDFYYEEEMLCESGCDLVVSSEELVVSSFGRQELEFVTDCHTGKRFKGGSRGLFLGDDMKNVDFEKRMRMVDDSEFVVNFYGSKTEGDFPVTDFIPDEFEVFNVSDGGVAYDEDGYYAIEWRAVEQSAVEQVSFNFSYYIKPKPKLSSCDFGAGGWRLEAGGLMDWQVVDLKVDDFYFECNFTNDISLYVVESVDFSREMGKKIKNKEGISVHLEGSVNCGQSDSWSVGVSECQVAVEFREFVPIEFDVGGVSDGGRVEVSSSNYNVIVWDVNGSSFDFSYNVMPRVVGDFSFMSEFGGTRMDEENISVYNFVPPIRRSRGGSGGYVFKPRNFSKVDSGHALIDKEGNMTVALFSNNFTSRGALELFGVKFSNRIYNRSLRFFDAYSVESNLGDNVGGFVFEYKVDWKVLRDKKYRSLEFYGVDKKGSRNRLTGMSVVDEGGLLTYRFDSNEFFRSISVYGVKEGLSGWDRILQWIWNVVRR